MAETSKAKERRIKEGFYEKYIYGKKVIDVGVGRLDTHDGADPISLDAELHDKDICDATTMEAYQDETFDTVYASHILEHLATQTSPTRPATPSAIATLQYLSANSFTTNLFTIPYISSQSQGQATISHPANTLVNMTYRYIIVG